jgi:predicted nucleic-acid-binding protein
MIGVDTNILARFYVDDPNDPEAAKQRPIARRILTESKSLFVPLTVILELNGFYVRSIILMQTTFVMLLNICWGLLMLSLKNRLAYHKL